MVYREYRDTGEKISLLGFGCMRLPRLGGDGQEIDEALGQRMVDYALAHGVNYFDTAWPYHGGLSEGFIGRALGRHPRESFYLADKLPTWEIQCEADVGRYLDLQLARCGVDDFDFYLVHNICAEHVEIFEKHRIFDRLLEKKREGKIRRLGFSSHSACGLLERVAGGYPWDFAQIQLNYLDWEMQDAKRQYEILAGRGIPVVVMEPVRGGSLATLSPPALEILREAGASPAALALRFAASLPGVLTVLSGMSNFEQVRENVETMTGFQPLSEAEYALLARVRDAYLSAGAIPCTGCRYCMDCPAGVDIPRIFAIANQYRIEGNKPPFARAYEYLGEKRQAKACVGCGSCLPRCPQGIDIPARLAEVAALADSLF